MKTAVRRMALAVWIVAMLAIPVQAQEKPVEFFVAGTMTAPLSGTADHFSPGFGAGGGLVWNLGEQSGIRVDYVWSTLRPKEGTVPVPGPPFDVSANVQYGTATFVFQAPPGRARLYLLGGVGVYRRAVTVSGGGSGLVTVCNPWWFVCEDGPVPAAQIAGSRSTTNIGVNVGFGLSFGRMFADIRYHYAAGPSFETSEGEMPATGKFIPLTVGVRF